MSMRLDKNGNLIVNTKLDLSEAKQTMKFGSAKEMMIWLIMHEGEQLGDEDGRRWKYENFEFYFKDFSDGHEWQLGVLGMQLFGTDIYKVHH